VVAIGLLVAGLILAYNNSETFRNILNEVFGAVKQVVDFLRPIGETYFDGLKLAFNAIKTVLSGYAKIVTEVFDAFVAVYNFLSPKVAGAFDGIKNAFGKLEGPIGLVKTAFGGLQTLAEGVIGVLDKVKTGAFNALASCLQGVDHPGEGLCDRAAEGQRALGLVYQPRREEHADCADWTYNARDRATAGVPSAEVCPSHGRGRHREVPHAGPYRRGRPRGRRAP
jgi:phage-related minor tail protein